MTRSPTNFVFLAGLPLLLAFLSSCNYVDTLTKERSVIYEAHLFVGVGQSNMEFLNSGTEFRSRLRERGLSPVFLNLGVGGSTLDQWEKGGPFYQVMKTKIDGKGSYVELKALLFWQGETEALGIGGNAATWKNRFEQFVIDARAEFNNPTLPVFFVQLGANANNLQSWDDFKTMQASIQMPFVYMIQSDDIAQSDGVHLTAEGYGEMARRIANRVLDEMTLSNTIHFF